MKVKSIKVNTTSCKKVLALLFASLLLSLFAASQIKIKMADEVWKREILYWRIVEKQDTVAYKNLWHKDFIGYTDNTITNKRHIANWITEMFKDKEVKYTIDVHKKAVNVVDNIVMTFYDVDYVFTNTKTGIIKKETYKITHTWKKIGST